MTGNGCDLDISAISKDGGKKTEDSIYVKGEEERVGLPV